MNRWRAERIYREYVRTLPEGGLRVHRQRRVPFVGRGGHHYVLMDWRPPRAGVELAELLALLTSYNRNREVALTRVNSTYILYISPSREAAATLTIMSPGDGVEEFEWVAHTHPLELETDNDRIARGPTASDRRALRLVFNTWQRPMSSTVVVCRGGRIWGAPVPFSEPMLDI